MAGIKRELEDLSLKAIDPDAYREIAQKVAARREERENFLLRVRERLEEGLRAAGIKGEIVARPKHFFSIYQKLATGRDFQAIYDLFGVRIVTHLSLIHISEPTRLLSISYA